MRNSSVEQLILQTLAREHAHLTSQQVYHELRRQLPAVNASTVYRALERLAVAGRVSVSDLGTGAVVYELLADGLHHHLVCQKCGHIHTIDNELVGPFFDAVEQRNGFALATRHLVLFGTCPVCQEAPSVGAV